MSDTKSAAAAILIALAIKKKNKKKRLWCKEWLKKRNEVGHVKLLKSLEESSTSDYNNFLRMEKENYTELLDKVTPMITKTRTKLREPISPHERLSLTLRFLASGQTFEDLKFSTLIAPQTIGKIVIETCEAIIHVLKDNIKVN